MKNQSYLKVMIGNLYFIFLVNLFSAILFGILRYFLISSELPPNIEPTTAESKYEESSFGPEIDELINSIDISSLPACALPIEEPPARKSILTANERIRKEVEHLYDVFEFLVNYKGVISTAQFRKECRNFGKYLTCDGGPPACNNKLKKYIREFDIDTDLVILSIFKNNIYFRELTSA